MVKRSWERWRKEKEGKDLPPLGKEEPLHLALLLLHSLDRQ